MEKKFFLIPLDIKSNARITPKYIRENQEAKKKEELILKKKETIFNKDLSGLINQVKQKPKLEPKEILVETKKKELNKKFSDLLETIYTEENQIQNVYKYLSTILFDANVNSYIVLRLDEPNQIYSSMLYSGVSEETFINTNFYKNDSFIQFGNSNLKRIEFSSENLEDVFFKKKFSDIDLKEYSGFYFLKIEYNGNSFIILLFYKLKLILDFKKFEEKINSHSEEISYLIPFFNKLVIENEFKKTNKDLDIITEELNLIRKKISINKETYLYSILILEKGNDVSGIKKKVLSILDKILSTNSTIMDSSFNKITIISEIKFDKEFYNQFESFELIFNTKKYDPHENIYLFI